MELVYCKDCIHRPLRGEKIEITYAPHDKDGYRDYTCPFLCPDPWYNRRPDDYFFCKYGEKELPYEEESHWRSITELGDSYELE